jgi:hypothetical protein
MITYYHLLIACNQCVKNKRCKRAILELVTKILPSYEMGLKSNYENLEKKV